MSVPATVALTTLGVRDVAAATEFYVSLGFPLSSASVPGEVSFFRTAGAILAVWGSDELRADAGGAADAGSAPFRGVALAINVPDPAAVDAALAAAVAAGGRVTRAAEATDWGGYNGY